MTKHASEQQQIPIEYLSLPKKAQKAIEQAYSNGQHVYFILSAAHNLIKIGVARNPNTRLRTMQTGSPTPLEIIHIIPYGGYWLESKLHKLFNDCRQKGEWFEYTSKVQDFISETKSLTEGIKWNNLTAA